MTYSQEFLNAQSIAATKCLDILTSKGLIGDNLVVRLNEARTAILEALPLMYAACNEVEAETGKNMCKVALEVVKMYCRAKWVDHDAMMANVEASLRALVIEEEEEEEEEEEPAVETVSTGINRDNVTATQGFYFEFIENTARNYLAECVARVGCDLDDVLNEVSEGLHELVGSLDIAIYYHHHLPIIQYSTYADEFINEFGAESAGDILERSGLEGLHAAIAEYCIWGDLHDRINDEAEDYVESVLEAQDTEEEC